MVEKTDYSALAEPYAAHRRAHPGVLAQLCAVVEAGSSVLEIGCGTGNYLAAVRELRGCECTGVDPSPQMLERLRARNLPVRVIDGSAERLGFANAEFDLAYSVDVIHHVRDRTAAFSEAFRVLRPGGATCVVTDSEWMIRNRMQSIYFPETIDVELARYPAIATLRAELADAGFGALREETVEHAYDITDAAAYRAKVFSTLLYISEQAFERGLARLESDLLRGPIRKTSRYMMLWAVKPMDPVAATLT